MIVYCAYCGPLGLDLLERLGEYAWRQCVADEHPDWPELKVARETTRVLLIDGDADAR